MSIPTCAGKKTRLSKFLPLNRPLMDAEKVLNFYDWIWFHRHIFEKEPTFSFWSSSEANPDGENGVKASEEATSVSGSGSLSPNSVLSTSKLRSLFAETTDLESSKTTPSKAELKKMRIRRRRCERKSLSELEFDEVKGFRDLGFVFSEEDKNSSLASVIPGLNRLGLEEEGKEDEEEEEEEEEEKEDLDESRIPRPYLSEVWEVLALDRRREEMNPMLRNWKLPSLSSETDMKENLRWWAHTVASTVR